MCPSWARRELQVSIKFRHTTVDCLTQPLPHTLPDNFYDCQQTTRGIISLIFASRHTHEKYRWEFCNQTRAARSVGAPIYSPSQCLAYADSAGIWFRRVWAWAISISTEWPEKEIRRTQFHMLCNGVQSNCMHCCHIQSVLTGQLTILMFHQATKLRIASSARS